MFPFTLPTLAIAAALGLLICQLLPKRPKNLPPGPRPLPIIGNALDFPPSNSVEYQHWLKHKDTYGGISAVHAMGMTLVILHDRQAAQDLLERDAAKTSGRPAMIFANKYCGYEDLLSSQGYNDTFRRYRKLLHRELGTKASVLKFSDSQEVEVRRHLLRALEEPDKWLDHYKTSAGATILKMTYDYTIEPHRPDVLVDLIERMMNEFSLAAVPLAWSVDLFPILGYLPESFPGLQFKKIARRWRKTIRDVGYVPFQFVQRQMEAGRAKTSYTSKAIESFVTVNDATGVPQLNREDAECIVWTAASLYGGASDTTVMVLTTFTLAMIQWPDVQRKAQGEIDRVVGTSRLPSFQDRGELPYVNAIVKEAFRWWPIAPMGFPHSTDDDIEYRGYHIPKGSYLIPAVWWFLHDPEVYSSPEVFDPERFLKPRDEPDPGSDAFGYGRRVCPGRHFADASIYLNIVQALATFNMEHAVDAAGNKIPVQAHDTHGILNHPSKFRFKVSPRSAQHEELIRKVGVEHPWEKSDASLLGGEGWA
ncbi:uncharacterized protein J7T54_008135 [Emericellopsis cladophorae]|uniref:O-methylsterigmatocystin oxidoreductase n=1 Tax=Emericellopsis cladophorae TaxID=2686198 RepID=A0A9P9Y7T6_9HYPO|nr:uncharacterized protein J7T54_008135 [Emericellopsis cladophorae]KAI6785041.1 hypothetical protein J7T54_008135 [Emericellopsis cladophorae]